MQLAELPAELLAFASLRLQFLLFGHLCVLRGKDKRYESKSTWKGEKRKGRNESKNKSNSDSESDSEKNREEEEGDGGRRREGRREEN